MASNPVKTPTSVYSVLLPNEAVTLDPGAFDNLLHNQGVRFVHYRAIRCPVGLVDVQDMRRPHADHSGCTNGFIYKPIGRVTGVFTVNSTDPKNLSEGFVDGSTAAITFPRFYDSDPTKRVQIRAYDRLYLDEEKITTAIWDMVARRRDGLPDRVEFPAVEVEHLVDSNNVWWNQGADFTLVNGDIVWNEGRGPDEGTVYTAWYHYRPFWYVDRLIHEIRVAPTADFIDGNKITMERLSFGAIVHREYVYRTAENDPDAPDQQRRQPLPPDEEAP